MSLTTPFPSCPMLRPQAPPTPSLQLISGGRSVGGTMNKYHSTCTTCDIRLNYGMEKPTIILCTAYRMYIPIAVTSTFLEIISRAQINPPLQLSFLCLVLKTLSLVPYLLHQMNLQHCHDALPILRSTLSLEKSQQF